MGFSEELHNVLLVERERIESQNKRTEVVRLAVEMNDASDKRQFDFQMAKLSAQTSGSKRKYVYASWVTALCITLITALASLLLYMMFWGSQPQSELAMSVLKILAYGVGGYGAIGAAVRALKTLMNSMGRQEGS